MFEDSAALISLMFATVGIWVSHHTGNPMWDAAASGAIGLLLVGVAVLLAVENYSLLIGEAASEGVERTIRAIVRDDPDVRTLVDLRTIHIGPRDVVVALGVEFPPSLPASGIEAAIERMETSIRRAVRETDAALIMIEPARPASSGIPGPPG